jgi:SAM-dependent methyltransferase
MTKLSDRYDAAAPAATHDAGERPAAASPAAASSDTDRPDAASSDAGSPDAASSAAGSPDAASLLVRVHAERPTVFGLLGDVTGKEVLDLVCGTGSYTRMISDRGAARVIGVDARAPLVELARSASRPTQRVEYHVLDALDMPHLGWFDVVVAGALFNHARTAQQVDALCRTVWSHLRPGGRFVGVLPNPDYDRRRPPDSRYGITYDWAHELRDGDDFVVRLHHVEPPVELTCRYWCHKTCRRALTAAGLRQIEIRPWQPSPEAFEQFGEPFWRPWLDNPLSVALQCVRQALPAAPVSGEGRHNAHLRSRP